MKKMLTAALVLMPKIALASMLGLYPYFRPLDIYHPQPIGGALVDVEDVQKSEGTILLPLLTHSPKDGCMLPSIVCEDWTPLAIGASVFAGKWTVTGGPVFNVLPIVQIAALAVIPNSWAGMRGIVGSSIPTVTFSAGPNLEYKEITNKGYFKIFTGVALHF